ncbi:MAG: protease [Candidatus Marinimicrobia bacterium CG_4_10_14_0_2_um_filter_48_9]|nr:MAG: protease [Candidatus Marinimicrobia bacterium CG_4_10_14_0_2_um_filter_48_9]
MKRFNSHLALVAGLLFTTLSLAHADGLNMAKALSDAFAQIAGQVQPSVVTITSEHMMKHPALSNRDGRGPSQDSPFYWFWGPDNNRELKTTSLGSGVIIDADGYIVTNNHVIEKGENIKVQFFDGKIVDAEIVGTDPKSDVALIKIDAKGMKLKPIKLGNSDKLRVGEWVLAIGSPFGSELSHTVTQGIVSAIGRSSVGLVDYENFIQTDAAINPGNSGGPLVNLDGELVGINTAIASRSGGYQGIGFAIPVTMVNRVTSDLRTKGKVVRAWLGVKIQNVDEAMAKTLELESAYGALVGEIVKDSPAANADLAVGDVVLKVNNEAVKNSRTLMNLIAAKHPEDKVTLTVLREGKQKEIKVKLAEFPEEYNLAADTRQQNDETLGMQVQNLDPKEVSRYGLDKDSRGVLVTSVMPGSEAQQKNVQVGMLIEKMGPTVRKLDAVASTKDYQRALSGYKSGDTVLFLMQREGENFFVALTIPEK